jgi:dynein light intermediate chain
VKYDTPILVSKTFGKGASSSNSSAKTSASSLNSGGNEANKAEDYLNSILPPREYSDAGQLWVQYVSPIPATRLDVIILQEELDKKLQERQARETGICPIREELYSQAFDELIRQVTINCAERGFLLVRVRDEIKMTIQAYQTLYESSIAYGMRKALQAEQSKAEKLLQLASLEKRCNEKAGEIEDLKRSIIDRLAEEEQEQEEKLRDHAAETKAKKDKNNVARK